MECPNINKLEFLMYLGKLLPKILIVVQITMEVALCSLNKITPTTVPCNNFMLPFCPDTPVESNSATRHINVSITLFLIAFERRLVFRIIILCTLYIYNLMVSAPKFRETSIYILRFIYSFT